MYTVLVKKKNNSTEDSGLYRATVSSWSLTDYPRAIIIDSRLLSILKELIKQLHPAVSGESPHPWLTAGLKGMEVLSTGISDTTELCLIPLGSKFPL